MLTINPSITQDIDDIINELKKELERQNIHGYALNIISKQDTYLSYYYGFTDLSKTQKISENTIFCLQSTTKSLTTLAIMIAENIGLLKLDDTIYKYCQDIKFKSKFDEKEYQTITFRHLLSHSSGIVCEARLGGVFNNTYCTWEDHVKSCFDSWLLFPVGSSFSYSNIGMDLAVYVLERITNQPYSEFIDKYIAKPLKIDILFDLKMIFEKSEIARGHSWDFQTSKTDGIAFGCGGAYLSMSDMTVLARLFLNKGRFNDSIILPDKYFDEMISVNGVLGYGLGTMVDSHNGISIPNHPGGGFGYSSDFYWLPEYDLSIIAFSNQEDSLFSMKIHLKKLLFHVLKAKRHNISSAPRKTGSRDLIDLNIERLSGVYRGVWGNKHIVWKNDSLVIDNGYLYEKLIAVNKNQFLTEDDKLYEFSRDDNYNPLKLTTSTELLGDISYDFVRQYPNSPINEDNINPDWIGIYSFILYHTDILYVAILIENGYLTLYGMEKYILIQRESTPNIFDCLTGEVVIFQENSVILPSNTVAIKRENIVQEMKELKENSPDHRHLEGWILDELVSKLKLLGSNTEAEEIAGLTTK